MPFSEEDKRRLFEFYDPAIAGYGPHDARSLRWSEEAGQQERFRLLSEVGVTSDSSVLDIGCGFGDLYQYLRERFAGITYTGIDINPHMIDVARQKYREADFEIADFGSWAGEPHDFVLASGAFSFKITDYRDVYLGYVQKMFGLAGTAAAFNMLDGRFHIDDAIFATYDPEEIEAFCRGLTPQVEVREKYLRQDFTIYMYI